METTAVYWGLYKNSGEENGNYYVAHYKQAGHRLLTLQLHDVGQLEQNSYEL